MSKIAPALLVAVLTGCAANGVVDESDEPIATDEQAIGTTSTPGVAEWSKRLSSSAGAVSKVATDPSGNVLFAGDTYGVYTSGGTLAWSKSRPGNVAIAGLSSNASGQMILTGRLAGTADFGCGTVEGNRYGVPFIAVLTGGGTCVQSRVYNYGDADMIITAVGTDAAGNIYIGAPTFSLFDLGCGEGLAYFGSFVVAKLGSDLSCKWQRIYREPTSDESIENNVRFNNLAVDPNGNVYAVGGFRNRIDFGAGEMTSNGSYFTTYGEAGTPFQKRHMVGFLLKLTTDGNYAWAKQLGVNADTTAVTASKTRVAVGGEFLESIDFGDSSFSTTSTSPDIYIAKYNQYGDDLWSRRFSGTAGQTLAGIAFDQYGYVDVAGSFQTSSTTATRSFTIGSNTWYVSSAAKKMFLTKLGNEKGSTVWAKTFGSSTGHVAPAAIATAPNGRIVVDGVWDGSVNFGNGSMSATTPTSFVAKFFQ